jgi:hypothetical protein
MRLLIACIVTLLAACGGSSKKDTAPPPLDTGTSTATTTPDTGGELRIYEGDRLVMSVAPDGALRIVEAGDEPIGTLGPDNSITVNGATAKLHEDGTITIDGQELPFTIAADASVHGPGAPPVKLEPDGTISGQGPGARPLRVEGATSPELRRRAMFLLLLATMPETEPGDEMPAEEESPRDVEMPAPPDGDGAVDDM